MRTFDIIVIGAGPAGIAAATLASEQGAQVAVIDEQQAGGGQVYRGVASADPVQLDVLGADYASGRDLIRRLDGAQLAFFRGATVWDVSDEGTVTFSSNDKATQVLGKIIILATGALERPVPVPGWTMPGVLTAGAAQILMKSSGLVPEGAVIAGSGPLIYLLAAQMIAAASAPIAIVELQSRQNLLRASRHLRGALLGRHLLLKGKSLLSTIRRAGVRRYRYAKDLRINGTETAERVFFQCGRKQVELSCSTVLLHQGVVPNTQVTRALQLDHLWDGEQHCFRPVLDEWGQTSSDRIYVAGDNARIGGATAAEHAGQLSAIAALHQLGFIERHRRDAMSAAPRSGLRRECAARPFLDALYSPAPEIRAPSDATIVCRCEAVTAGDVRRYAGQGCTGPNQTKAFGRVGMGPCQGRYCALTVTEILAAEHGMTHDAVGSYRIRAPLKTVTLGEVASITNKSPD